MSRKSTYPVVYSYSAGAQDPTKYAGGGIPSVEPSLPAAYSSANLNFSGANALATDFLRPCQGYGDITDYFFDGNSTCNSFQLGVHRRFARFFSTGLAYTRSKTMTTVSDDSAYTNMLSPRKYDYALATFDRPNYMVWNFIWDLPKLAPSANRVLRGVTDGWQLSGVTTVYSGAPIEPTLTISGVDAGIRLLGTSTNTTALAGQQPRFRAASGVQNDGSIDMTALSVPGIGDAGPYSRFFLRNPGINNQDLSIMKNFRFDKEGKHYLQIRVEAFNAFNHTQFSGYNLTTSVTNAAGATGSSIFNNFTGLKATNNIRGSSSTSVMGTYFGEHSSTAAARVVEVAVKFYF
jgi:hypothetical protein